MTEKKTVENVRENAGNYAARCHKEDSWTPECCWRRIHSGCCQYRNDPELDDLRREKIEADWMYEVEQEERKSGLYNEDMQDSSPVDGSEALLDSNDDTYEIQF